MGFLLLLQGLNEIRKLKVAHLVLVMQQPFCMLFLLFSLSLQPHGLQYVRLLCLPLSPRVCSNSCPLSWWWYLITSFSATSFSPSFCTVENVQLTLAWTLSGHCEMFRVAYDLNILSEHADCVRKQMEILKN